MNFGPTPSASKALNGIQTPSTGGAGPSQGGQDLAEQFSGRTQNVPVWGQPCLKGSPILHAGDNHCVGSLVRGEGHYFSPKVSTSSLSGGLRCSHIQRMLLCTWSDLRLRARSSWSLAGFLIGCGAPQLFSFPWPLTLIPFRKIRLLEDGFQQQHLRNPSFSTFSLLTPASYILDSRHPSKTHSFFEASYFQVLTTF